MSPQFTMMNGPLLWELAEWMAAASIDVGGAAGYLFSLIDHKGKGATFPMNFGKIPFPCNG
ncbi:hypothetical protein AN963_08360 [Brevibacillus choshinensis]|uniref:Uncharacterized protein n=1 Tax=Brevibacillus choshinensis TaxID=54911 RepID=A0ABR5NDT5_BRECH|nr:hypothetical protein AN963_08360 [Brevibacillus choshinensis]